MNRTARIIIGVCVLVAAAGVAGGLSSIDNAGGYSGLSPRFLPTLVAVGLAVCGAALLVGALRSAAVAAPADTPAFMGSAPLAWLLGGLLVHLVLITWIGFVAASVILLTCAARGHGSTRPIRDALIALALSFPVWWLFAKGLGLGLPLMPLLKL